MEIVEYEPTLEGAVADCYNRLVEGLPHCFPVEAGRVGAVMEGRDSDRQELKSLHDDWAWVAREGDEVAGFAHTSLQKAHEDRHGPRGVIRFFAYDVGQRAAGQALLEAVEAHFRERGMPEVIAFHQDQKWPCYHFPHAYLSDRVMHVHGLLGMNGYARVAGEVYWDWTDLEPPEPPPTDVEAAFRAEHTAGKTQRPSFVIRAFRGDEQIGQCWCVSCGEAAPGTEAEDWCITTWLEVEDEWRGRRFGAHLLARALREMRQIGFRHAAISTSWTNFRAQLFYANFGYRASDWTYALAKSFDE